MSQVGTALIVVGAVLLVAGIAGLLLRRRPAGPPGPAPDPTDGPQDGPPACDP